MTKNQLMRHFESAPLTMGVPAFNNLTKTVLSIKKQINVHTQQPKKTSVFRFGNRYTGKFREVTYSTKLPYIKLFSNLLKQNPHTEITWIMDK